MMLRFFITFLFACFTLTVLAQDTELRQYNGHTFEVVRIECDPEVVNNFDFIVNSNRLSFKDFVNSQTKIRQHPFFLMNGGIYAQQDNKPMGLFMAEGVEFSPLDLGNGEGNFFLKPNGVFAIDQNGQAIVQESSDFAKQQKTFQFATQSGPMLVNSDKLHPKFNEGSPNKHERLGVGISVDRSGKRSICFVIARSPVNFYTFATFFKEELSCSNALCLESSACALYNPFGTIESKDLLIGSFILLEY